jgi:hypothetical protein
MNCGYASGWCEESFGIKLVGRELLCKARGDEDCLLISAHPNYINQKIETFMKKHPTDKNGNKYNYYIENNVPGFFERSELKDLKEKKKQISSTTKKESNNSTNTISNNTNLVNKNNSPQISIKDNENKIGILAVQITNLKKISNNFEEYFKNIEIIFKSINEKCKKKNGNLILIDDEKIIYLFSNKKSSNNNSNNSSNINIEATIAELALNIKSSFEEKILKNEKFVKSLNLKIILLTGNSNFNSFGKTFNKQFIFSGKIKNNLNLIFELNSNISQKFDSTFSISIFFNGILNEYLKENYNFRNVCLINTDDDKKELI